MSDREIKGLIVGVLTLIYFLVATFAAIWAHQAYGAGPLVLFVFVVAYCAWALVASGARL